MKKLIIIATVLTLNLKLETENCFAQFTNLWTQTNNPSTGSDAAQTITADASGIYVAGWDAINGWRIEKRNLTTGALDAAFGTAGVVTSNPGTDARAITTDASGIYVAGYDWGPGNIQWHIEKRDLTTGNIIWTQIINPSAGEDIAQAITTGASGIYLAGWDESPGAGNWQWRIEKRDLTTGALDATFGTAGAVTSNPSAGGDRAYTITADATGIYVAGWDRNPGVGNSQWRIEKRDLTTGVLDAAFGTAGVVTSNPSAGNDQSYAITADASGIYVAGYGGNQYIEKRNLTTGTLDAAFGTAGVIISNPGAYPYAITVDASGIYVAEVDAAGGNQWRIEKRNLITGAIICTQTSNPSAGNDVPRSITADATGIYVAGLDEGPGDIQWRIEKYDLCGVVALSATITTTAINCNGQCTGTATTTPIGGTSPFTYSWSGGQTTATISGLCAGTYSIIITDAASATFTSTVSITQPATVITTTVTATPVSSCIINNGSATVAASGGTTNYSYLWNTGGQTTSIATGLSAGNYSVTITDANGCTTTQTVSVTSNNTMILNTSSTPTGCNINTGTATANPSNGTSPYYYNWSNGQTTSVAVALAVGSYTAIVTDANGCTATQTVSVTQIPGPIAIATANPSIITIGNSATLTATGGGTYLWSPATGLSCDTCSTTTATPNSTTPYCVTVTDGNNCTATACVTITIQELLCGAIYVPNIFAPPNAFTPNKDKDNEQLCAYGNCIEKMELIIYNRWGQKVFETTDISQCWDGTYKGKPLNTAVFVYYMKATLTTGEKISKKGNVSLIR